MYSMITQATFEERREKVRKLLSTYELCALFVSEPANRYYLSGFEMGDIHTYSVGGYVLITKEGKDILFTDARYEEAAYRIWDKQHVVLYSSSAQDIADYLSKNVQGAIGFEEYTMSVGFYNTLAKENSLVPADSLVPKVRAVKEESEIELMKQSVNLNHMLMEQVENLFYEGVTEREIAWKIEQFYKNAGASHLSFSSIVAFGKNSALPHYDPEEKGSVLHSNMPVLIDCGCVYHSYCSDQTRTFWFGDSPSKEYETTYALVHEAQQKSIEGIRAGKTCHEIYMIAYEYFEQYGVAKYFTHGLGHGIGVAVHEDPRLRRNIMTPLEENMVVTVEPGLYYPEWGGVRLEYMVRVREDGCEIL
ncbi:MAG: Xaa-Pro peptidase family protein [Desulfovibrionaceae bacterium]|nr:Xaa-Pro peptidase family protein [Desulfovibrionaceae bacterium]